MIVNLSDLPLSFMNVNQGQGLVSPSVYVTIQRVM